MATKFWTDSSLLLGLQDDLNTPSSVPANEFVPILCDSPKVTFNTEVTELDLLTGQVGAAPEKVVGRRSGSVSFTVPLQALKAGYDPTAESPGVAPAAGAEVIPPWMVLVSNALGSYNDSLAGGNASARNTNFWRGTTLSNATYSAAGITAAGTDATHLELDVGAVAGHKAGQFIAAAKTGLAPGVGFVKAKDGATSIFTVFDPMTASSSNYDDNAANVYGSTTAWQSNNQPKFLTAYWVGPDATLAYVMTGLTCESFKITLEPGATPTAEFSFRFYDFYMDKTKGGLVVPKSYNRVPQLVGAKTGAAVLDNSLKCGLEGLMVEWKATITETKCHAATQGISAIQVVKPRVLLNFTIPHIGGDTGDAVYDANGAASNVGSHVWQSSLELGTKHSLGVYVGPGVGKALGVLVPAAYVSAAPSIADKNGVQTYTVAMEATSYSGDTTTGAETSSDSPINSIFRVGLA